MSKTQSPAKVAFPHQRLVEGHGFDHEIVDANGEYYTPLARVYAHDDDGLRLARLFTVAPDLLAICEALLEPDTGIVLPGELITDAREAIAKVKGVIPLED